MSIQDLFELVGNYPLFIMGFFVLPPFLAWLMARFDVSGEGPKYLDCNQLKEADGWTTLPYIPFSAINTTNLPTDHVRRPLA